MANFPLCRHKMRGWLKVDVMKKLVPISWPQSEMRCCSLTHPGWKKSTASSGLSSSLVHLRVSYTKTITNSRLQSEKDYVTPTTPD